MYSNGRRINDALWYNVLKKHPTHILLHLYPMKGVPNTPKERVRGTVRHLKLFKEGLGEIARRLDNPNEYPELQGITAVTAWAAIIYEHERITKWVLRAFEVTESDDRKRISFAIMSRKDFMAFYGGDRPLS